MNQSDMTKLFERANAENKWLYCAYQGLWFSPSELKAAQENGRFRWGAQNWTLRDPLERCRELDREIKTLIAEKESLALRIATESRQ